LDSKTKLLHSVLAITKDRNFAPTYKILSESGAPHIKIFTVGVYVVDRLIATGKGFTRHSAEQSAASEAFEKHLWLKDVI